MSAYSDLADDGTAVGAIWSISRHFSLNDLGGPVAFATTSTVASEGILESSVFWPFVA